jgi:hypothetical protein
MATLRTAHCALMLPPATNDAASSSRKELEDSSAMRDATMFNNGGILLCSHRLH